MFYLFYILIIFPTGKYLSILAHLILIKLQMVTTLFYHFNCKTKNRETGRLRILLKTPQVKHHSGSGQSFKLAQEHGLLSFQAFSYFLF